MIYKIWKPSVENKNTIYKRYYNLYKMVFCKNWRFV